MEYLKVMTTYFLPLQPDAFYHLYNRGNNGERIFYKNDNYRYFLQKFDAYMSAYLHVYAYALLPNHFHFLVKAKRSDEIESSMLQVQAGSKILVDYPSIVSETFRRFFLCYAKAIKIQEGRTGSLFEKNFKRKEIKNEKHLLWVINYIHRNPETHGFVPDFRPYPFSSYRTVLSDAPTKLARERVLDLFGGREEFSRFHLTNPVIPDDALLME